MPMLHAPKHNQPQVMAEMEAAAERLAFALQRMTAYAKAGNYAAARDSLAAVRAYVTLIDADANILRGEWADQ